MRFTPLLFSLALGLSACGGKTTTAKPPGGDPATGDPSTGDVTMMGDSVGGDPISGDPVAGDPVTGDPVAGDPMMAGDPPVTMLTPSTQLCAAGGKVSSSSYRGTVCLSPLGSGGQISTSSSYKWIPGPAHIVEAE